MLIAVDLSTNGWDLEACETEARAASGVEAKGCYDGDEGMLSMKLEIMVRDANTGLCLDWVLYMV